MDLPFEAALGGLVGVLAIIGLVAAFVAAHFIAKAAVKKHRSYGAFFVLSILLSPLVTAAIVAALPFDENDPRRP
jgi:MFS superfamily sulfate permease-like transporter